MRNSSIIMYTTEDGLTKIETTFDEDTVWLSLDQMAELFQRDKSTISRHIKNIFEEGELQRNSVVANFATTASDGKTYQVDYYNLDVIISVGYRVKSRRGTQFRIWAMGILKEYMKKGFALDDDRLKRLGGGNYFDELLARIRDIRSSEKVFWRKVLEIYATSIDYDPHAESSVLFFKQVQNKMHWAAHKHTAAEVIYERADAEKENMGLTSWEHNEIRRSDVEVAKNYLTEQELDALNKIVTAYLDIAEVHALNKEPMYMKTASDAFIAITDFICPDGGPQDEGIARSAYISAIEESPEIATIKFEDLTSEQIMVIVERTMANAIFNRITNDIGNKIILLPQERAISDRLIVQMKDFVKGSVSDAVINLDIKAGNIRQGDSLRIVDRVYKAAFEIMESAGENE